MTNFHLAVLYMVFVCGVTAEQTSPTGHYSDHPRPVVPPKVTFEPFLPPGHECWNLDDKFSHPKEMTPPRFEYPIEVHSGYALGKATVLVQIDEFGFPKRLAVLSSEGELPPRLAVEALKKARWWTEPNRHGCLGVWFLYKAEYPARVGPPEETSKPNQPPQHKTPPSLGPRG